MDNRRSLMTHARITLFRYGRFRFNCKLVLGTLAVMVLFGYYLNYKQVVDAEEKIQRFREKRYEQYQRRPMLNGPGEDGKAVTLSPEEAKLSKLKYKDASFNIVASDKTALDRRLPDTRRKECLPFTYPEDLPSVSVILVFCNEALSTMLRSIHSIVNRTPPRYLHEIILVDDFSDHEELKENLDRTVARIWPDNLVRIVRRDNRGGLIRARMSGARAATGEVLVMMDAHIEVIVGWLQPLLARIKEQPESLVLPVIDTVAEENMKLIVAEDDWITGFTWTMLYTWLKPPEVKKQTRTNATAPLESPTMVGCAFAIRREYFFHIGGFDEGMDIWGGENIELPLRIWMCGGRVELIPCSRIAHLYRKTHPYTFPDGNKSVIKNAKRVVDVWLDNHKRMFYLFKPDLKNLDVGDLSERKKLRKDLKCHSFEWFIENVYPELFVLDEKVYAFGQVSNPSSHLCLDTLMKNEAHKIPIAVYKCQPLPGAQVFALSHKSELRRDYSCAWTEGKEGSEVKLIRCHGRGGQQEWRHDKETGSLIHVASGKCLDSAGLGNSNPVRVRTCNNGRTQAWEFENYIN